MAQSKTANKKERIVVLPTNKVVEPLDIPPANKVYKITYRSDRYVDHLPATFVKRELGEIYEKKIKKPGYKGLIAKVELVDKK